MLSLFLIVRIVHNCTFTTVFLFVYSGLINLTNYGEVNVFFLCTILLLHYLSLHIYLGHILLLPLTLFLHLKQVLTFLNDVFDTLLKALSDPSDAVIFLLLPLSRVDRWCFFYIYI